MDLLLIAVGAIAILIGLIRHFLPDSLPQTRYRLVKLPAIMTAGIGVLLLVAGILK